MVDFRYRRPVGDFEKLKIFAFPLFLENVLVLILFTIIFLLAAIYSSLPAGMGIRSVTIWFVCITLFFNYAFVIVDYTSRGLQRVPKLSGELVFPTHDSRLFSIAGLTLCYLAFLYSGSDDGLDTTHLLVAFFTYPLMFSLLIVHTRVLSLLNPVKLIRTLYIFSSSLDSLVFYSLQLATACLLYFVIVTFGEVSTLNLFWEVPLSLVMLFILFRSLGVVLNTQGPKFGLSVLQNEESHQQALEEEARYHLDEFVFKLHRWIRVHEYKTAFAMIREFQAEHRHELDDTLFARLSQLEDKRLASMLGADLCERLYRNGEKQRSLKVFREAFDMAPDRFSFSNGSQTLVFAKEATDEASRRRIFHVLQSFDHDFPSHPNIAGAMLIVAAMATDEFNMPDVAADALDKAVKANPDVTNNAEYQRIHTVTSSPRKK
jgi:hypothetical protein